MCLIVCDLETSKLDRLGPILALTFTENVISSAFSTSEKGWNLHAKKVSSIHRSRFG